jgi:hypothetical protein
LHAKSFFSLPTRDRTEKTSGDRELLLNHPIEPIDAQWGTAVNDILLKAVKGIRGKRNPVYWGGERGGIIRDIRVPRNAVDRDDGMEVE